MRCGHTHQIAVLQRRAYEHLRDREPVRGQVVVGEGARLIRIVEKHHRPGPGDEARRLHEVRGRGPHRHNELIDVDLHRRNQLIQIDAQWNGGLVEHRDLRDIALVERPKFRFRHDLTLLLTSCSASLRLPITDAGRAAPAAERGITSALATEGEFGVPIQPYFLSADNNLLMTSRPEKPATAATKKNSPSPAPPDGVPQA